MSMMGSLLGNIAISLALWLVILWAIFHLWPQ